MLIKIIFVDCILIYLSTMDSHTVVIDAGIVDESWGVNIFLTLLGGGVTYVTQKWKGGVI
jgi:hypothetical protein